MHKMPSLSTGTTVQWQKLHRTVRAQFAQELVAQKRLIRFRTYAQGEMPPTVVRLTTIILVRQRGNGNEYAFLYEDADQHVHSLNWSRLVEVELV